MRARALLALVALLSLPLATAGGGADGTAAKDPRNFSWVEEGVLAVGGGGLNESEVDTLHALGFRAIADFRAEHADPAAYIASKGMPFFDMPIDSASDINATQLAQFVDWAREQKAAGRPIYIHCTNGWHRAAAFAVAWDLAQRGKAFEDAARDAAQRRPGSVMRATAGILDYEATIDGRPQLAVVLVSPLSHPGLNATMPVHVDVYANGALVANATVKVWSEESKLRIDGVTGPDGRFSFTYSSPSSAFMDHVYARASLDGFADGADNIEFIFGQPARTRGPLEVAAERTDDGVVVRATHNGKAVPVRVVGTADGWTAFEASDRGVVRFPDAPTASAVRVRVVSWGSDGGSAELAAVAPPPPPPEPELPPEPVVPPEPALPPPDPAVPPEPIGPALPPETSGSPREHALRYAAAGVVGAALLAGCVALARKRSPAPPQ